MNTNPFCTLEVIAHWAAPMCGDNPPTAVGGTHLDTVVLPINQRLPGLPDIRCCGTEALQAYHVVRGAAPLAKVASNIAGLQHDKKGHF